MGFYLFCFMKQTRRWPSLGSQPGLNMKGLPSRGECIHTPSVAQRPRCYQVLVISGFHSPNIHVRLVPGKGNGGGADAARVTVGMWFCVFGGFFRAGAILMNDH